MGDERNFRQNWVNWRIHPAIVGLFILCLLYEVHVSFSLPQLYFLLKILFYTELIVVLISFGRAARKEPFLWVLPIVVVGLRLPFLLRANGLIFTSDNALEAIQCLQIQETHQAPFFLLNAINHNGPFIHTLVAFVWDLLGSSYLTFVVMQLIIFVAFHVVLYYLLKKFINLGSLLLLLLLNFIFLPVIFDYSLYLRAAPYFHVLFFLVLGLSLFEPERLSPFRLFLSLYFAFFSLYINQVGVFFAFSLLIVVVFQVIGQRKWRLAAAPIFLAGLLAGFPWLIAWKKSLIPDLDHGKWYSIKFISLKEIFSPEVFDYLLKYLRESIHIFVNLFRYELNYLMKFFYQFEGKARLFSGLNIFLVIISAGILLFACYFFGRIILTDLRQRRLNSAHWLAWFFFLLLLAELGKNFLLLPSQFVGPRHHLDLAFLLMISYGVFFDRILKIKKFFSFRSLTVVLLLGVLSVPHIFYYYQQTKFKEKSYQQIIGFLEKHNIRYLTTDFIIAYPIYFLSKRRILVSNSLGPLTVRFFFPRMDRLVDALPADKKAYLFFGKNYYREKWHLRLTARKRKEVINNLRAAGIPFKIINLDRHFMIIPVKLLKPV